MMSSNNRNGSRNNRRRKHEEEDNGLGIINPMAIDNTNYPGGPIMAVPPAVNNVRATMPPPGPTSNFGNGADSTMANPEEIPDMDGICASKDDPFWVRRRFTRDDSFPELQEAMGIPSRHPAPPAFVQQQKSREQPARQQHKPRQQPHQPHHQPHQQQNNRHHGHHRQAQPAVPPKTRNPPHHGQVKADSRRKKDNRNYAPRNVKDAAPAPSSSNSRRNKFDPDFNQKYASQPRRIETPKFGSGGFKPPQTGGGFQPPPSNFRGPPKPHQNFNANQPQPPRKEFKPKNSGFKPPRASFKPPKNPGHGQGGFNPPMPGFQSSIPNNAKPRGREPRPSYDSRTPQAIALPGMSSGQPFSSLPRNSAKRREKSIPVPPTSQFQQRPPPVPQKTRSNNQENNNWQSIRKPTASGRSGTRKDRNPSYNQVQGGFEKRNERPLRVPTSSGRQEDKGSSRNQRGRKQPAIEEDGLDILMSRNFKSKRKLKTQSKPEEGPPPVPPLKVNPRNVRDIKNENSHLFDTDPSV